jgi:hypothetical protein
MAGLRRLAPESPDRRAQLLREAAEQMPDEEPRRVLLESA